MCGEWRRNGQNVMEDVPLAVVGDVNVSNLVAVAVVVAVKEARGLGGGAGGIAFLTPLPDPKSGSGNFPK